MTAPNKMAKRAAAGTLALAVCFTGGVLGASAAQAAPGFAFDTRFPGADRFETAVSASQAAFADGAGDVIVVQDDALADGLTASYLAGVKEAPILYVRQNEVPSVTAAELTRLGAERIYIVGGTAVVSSGVETSLRSNGRTVTRVAGSDRYETAARVATSDSNDVGTVFIANGDAPADALAAGPIAYKSHNPILLTRPMQVPASTTAALNQLQETNRIVLGGNAVVSTSTYTDLDATNRLRGPDRQGTAVAIADYATANEGFTKANAALVGSEDRNTADALIAAPILGQTGTPILFTTRGGLGVTSRDYLVANVDELTGEGYVFGGTDAVSQSIVDEATAAASGEAAPDPEPPAQGSISVTPSEDAVLTVSSADGTRDANRGIRQYTASVGDVEAVDIYLFDLDTVDRTATGPVVFDDEDGTNGDGNDEADFTPTGARITVVNGVGTDDDNGTVVDVTPVNGQVTFTINAEESGAVIPVVLPASSRSSDGSPRLALNDDDTPVAAFGLGGATTYLPIEAPAGLIGGDPEANTITRVDKATKQIATNTFSYDYDANDQFFIDTNADGDVTANEQVTLEEFEAQLSEGDYLGEDSNYGTEPSFISQFVLVDAAPAAPSLDAVAQDDESIQLTVGDADSDNVDEVRLYRADDEPAADELNDVESYTLIATLPAEADGTVEYTDSGLDDSEDYFYAATVVADGEESEVTTASASTLAEGATASPESTDVRLVTDATFQGELSGGDVFRVFFSREMDDLDGGEIIRVRDAQGEVLNLVNDDGDNDDADGSNAAFAFNGTPAVAGGQTYGVNQVLTVTLDADGDFSAGNTIEGADDRIQYPATIINQAGLTATTVAGPSAWTPVGDPDNVIDDEGRQTFTGGGAADTTPPTVTAVSAPADAAAAGTRTVTVTFTEPVQVETGGTPTAAAAGFSYDPDGAGAVAASNGTAIVFNADRTVATVTFATAGAVVAGDDTLSYTAPATPNRITDTANNPLVTFAARSTTNP